MTTRTANDRTSPARTQSDDGRSIREWIETWMAAARARDLQKQLSMLADDVIFMVPGREPFGKEEFAAGSQQMGNLRVDGRAKVLELEVLGNRAWCRNHLDVRITPPNGNSVTRSGYTLTIFRRNPDGAWVLWRDANLLLPH